MVPARLPLRHRAPDVGQLDEDDVAQLLLRVIGDADAAEIAGHDDPFVVFGVAAVGRIHMSAPGTFVELPRDDSRGRLEHRWFECERQGREISLEEALDSYIPDVLAPAPDEHMELDRPTAELFLGDLSAPPAVT